MTITRVRTSTPTTDARQLSAQPKDGREHHARTVNGVSAPEFHLRGDKWRGVERQVCAAAARRLPRQKKTLATLAGGRKGALVMLDDTSERLVSASDGYRASRLSQRWIQTTLTFNGVQGMKVTGDKVGGGVRREPSVSVGLTIVLKKPC